MTKIICILPTGEWSEINEGLQPLYITVNEEQLENLCDLGSLSEKDVVLLRNGKLQEVLCQ